MFLKELKKVDVSKLNTLDENGKLVTTGDYTLNKVPVAVKKVILLHIHLEFIMKEQLMDMLQK